MTFGLQLLTVTLHIARISSLGPRVRRARVGCPLLLYYPPMLFAPPCLAASKRHLPPISLTFVFSEEICSATSLHARLKQVFHYYTRPLLLKNRQDDQMNPSQFSSFSFVIFCIQKIIGKCLKLILLPLRNKLS